MRLFLYADEPILSEAVRLTLSGTEDLKLERILESAEEIVPAVEQNEPDLLLLSLTPELHLGTLIRLREVAPECHIVLWTRSFLHGIAHQAMDLGVRGILPRTCSKELMLKCLRKVYEGELWFDRQLSASHMSYHRVALTPRQAELVQMVAEGHRNKEIAAGLSISEGAVKVYLSHLLDKVGARDRTELAQLVIRNMQPVEYAGQFAGAIGIKLRALYVDTPEPEGSGMGGRQAFGRAANSHS